MAPLARALAADQSFQHRLVRSHAAGDVAHRNAHPGGALRIAGDGRQAAFGLHQQVVGLERVERPFVSVAGNGDRDQARVGFAQAVLIEPEAPDRAGGEVLDEDVGLGHHGAQQCLVLFRAQVEAHGFLAAVEPDEVGALALNELVVLAREVAFRPLDLDHACPGLGQPAGQVRRRHRLFDGHDEKTGQIPGHIGPPFRPAPTMPDHGPIGKDATDHAAIDGPIS